MLKNFYCRNLRSGQLGYSVCLDRPFQGSLMFFSKARAFLSEVSYRCFLKGKLLALASNIRLGWKGLSETNTLAYFTHP